MKMKYKIGVFGSAVEVKNQAVNRAKELGKELGKYKERIIIINGAASGIPSLITAGAAKRGVEVWGFSPAISEEEHNKEIVHGDDIAKYNKVFFVPKEFAQKYDLQVCRKYRNVISTANCDAGIIISGRWGTTNEFTNLFDMGKVIGVLTSTGGIADELPRLMKKIVKKGKAEVIFDKSPAKLIKKILKTLQK